MASKRMLSLMLLFLGAVAQDEKSTTIQWSDSSEVVEKVKEFTTAEGLTEDDWTSVVVYADGSENGNEKHYKEEFWPITVKFTKKSSLSEAAVAEAAEEEKKEAEADAEAAAEQAKKDQEEKEKAEEELRQAKIAAEREAEAARKAAEEAEKRRLQEEEERLKADQAEKEAAEAKRKAEEAQEKAGKDEAERLKKDFEQKQKDQEEQQKRLEEAEEERRKAVEEQRIKDEEAEKTRLAEEALAKQLAELRNLKWRWADDLWFGTFIPKMLNSKWNEPESRDALKKELDDKITGATLADLKKNMYNTRRVELADAEYPERTRIFSNYEKVLEWLALNANIAGTTNEEL